MEVNKISGFFYFLAKTSPRN
uniref:Uncharacterized protein n=1 Tax=Anguilla anguilla TaxID=7936 RepID=A0A0E9U2I9_ANGAN